MNLQPIAIPLVWGFDTSGKITPAMLEVLTRVDMHEFFPEAPVGTRPRILSGYCPLPGNAPGWDLTGADVALRASAGYLVLAFQHVRGGSWVATAAQGLLDGQYACEYLEAIGYRGAVGGLLPSAIKDCESVANPGPGAVSAMQAFKAACMTSGKLGAGAYNGFDSGLTPQQFADLGIPIARDAGDRSPPPGRGFAYEQRPQVVVGGMTFDPVCARPDLAGDAFIGMGDADQWMQWQDTTDPCSFT